MAQALQRHGVEHVFVSGGSQIQSIADGCAAEQIRLVETRHPASAGFAADACARVSGLAGVVLAAAGPGAASLLTPLATARMAGSPLVCLAGGAPTKLADLGAFQELDTLSMARAVTKWAARVTEPHRIREYVNTAFRRAYAGNPGPVYLEIPVDVLAAGASTETAANAPMFPPRPAASLADVDRARVLLAAAERPIVIVGSELRWSPVKEVVRRAAEQLAIPFFLNGMARGALPMSHPHLFAQARVEALRNADLALVLGTPFDFRLAFGRAPTWNADTKIIQVDLDAEELGRNRAVDLPIQADIGLFLSQLCEGREPLSRPEWVEHLRQLEQNQVRRAEADPALQQSPPHPLRLCHELGRRLGPEDILVGDGGPFIASVAPALPLSWPQLWLDSGPLGTLGIGGGFALAASVVRPQGRTVALFGDGTFGLSAMEFESMARQRLKVVAVVASQNSGSDSRRSQLMTASDDRPPSPRSNRYEQVVDALGGRGYWVERVEELGPALDGAFAADCPSVVHVRLSSGTDSARGH